MWRNDSAQRESHKLDAAKDRPRDSIRFAWSGGRRRPWGVTPAARRAERGGPAPPAEQLARDPLRRLGLSSNIQEPADNGEPEAAGGNTENERGEPPPIMRI